MPAYTTDAFVLRRLHYGETDNILTLYARDRGRFSAIAKGARKAISRLSGATEVLTLTRFGLASGRSLEIVTQVEVQDSFPNLRHDLLRLAHGLYLADLVDHSTEEHAPNPLLFDLLHAGLTLLQSVTPPELVARWFEVQLLRDLGYAPNLYECAVCHAPVPGPFGPDERFALSAALGGALCPRHARPASHDDHSGLSYEALALLQTLDAPEQGTGETLEHLALPNAKGLGEARLALRRSLRFRLERDLKSLEFLDSLRPV
ncbi:MAG: DNA repair protein RecO [Armatimonadetes bacterium]|nr:DNA repair protein RecO [Armatimonadota bacterium]